jgi:glycerate 2-kinase
MRTDPSTGRQVVDVTSTQRMRQVAREIFLHALSQSNIDRAFDRHMGYERGILRVGEDLYDLSSFSRIVIISIGKAGNTAIQALMNRLGGGVGATGIVCAPTNPDAQVFGFRYFKGGHPLPNLESLKSAESIIRSLESLSSKSLVIYLLSGGGSSLVEKPAFESISLEDLVATYRVLVHSGAPIGEINAIRKHLSATKGGRLARAAYPAHQLSILISDVPENELDSLASGPTMPDSSTDEQCYEIVKKYKLLPEFPPTVRAIFQSRMLDETPKSDDPAFVKSRYWTVLSNLTAQHAVVEKAAMSGFAIEIDNSVDDKDYKFAADHLLERLRELRKGVSSVCLISGGEVTVSVKGKSGVGGRNQQFALYCAEKIAGENITVLSAGTDGVDGNSPAAGAIVDGTTMERAVEKNFSPKDALQHFDAYPLFESLGDAIMTGPTGNNLRDLRILLAY